MASESHLQSEDDWHVGDKCLAPRSTGETLYEGTVQKCISAEHGAIAVVVKFAQYGEETVPVTKLQRLKSPQSRASIFDDRNLEKPLFHNRKSPGAEVSYKLSGNGESIPYTINRYLRDYQQQGVKFIYSHYIQGRGCVLGDDMGLGKTIQVISFLAAVLHKKGTRDDIERNVPDFLLSQKPKSAVNKVKKIFLIVAPLSVLYNWKEELDTWGHFRCTILHGTKKEEEFARVKREKCEIALTTYETLRLSLDDFNSIPWSAVIVDEAHKIKNPNSQITQAMKGLKCKVRVGLTGTILQNNMEELWCVMDWAIPGCLGSLKHFTTKFADPIEQGQKHSATKRSLALGRKAGMSLGKKISHWFLRRTKSLISDQLPKKDDRVVYCALTEFQQAVYQAVLDSEDVTLLLRSREKCSCGSGRQRKRCCFKTNSKGLAMQDLYFSYLTILRKVANHVALLQSKGNTSKQQEDYVNDICEKVFKRFPDFIQQSKQAAFETISDPKYSGKMKVLQQLLNHFMANKDKVLLFSLSTKLLDVLENYCMAEGIEYRRLDGNTKSKERFNIVKEFNSNQDINICLVSTMAGGLGLNFVGANIVVLFDPTWNPANDLQAIDRAYRIGQCRDVKVFRLISLGTVEEVIYLRQIYKQQLQCTVVGNENAKRYFEAVQGSEGHAGELFGLRNLFRLQTGGTCLTRQIIEREGSVEAGIMTAGTHTRENLETTSEHCSYSSKENTGKVPVELEKLKRDTKLSKAVLDFSSESENEQGKKVKTRPESKEGESSSSSPGLRSLLHFGLSEFLEGNQAATGESSESEGSSDLGNSGKEYISDQGVKAAPETGSMNRRSHSPVAQPSGDPESTKRAPQKTLQRQNWTVSSDSEGDPGLGNQPPHVKKAHVARENNSTSGASDDVICPAQGYRKVYAKRRTREDCLFRQTKESDSESTTDQSILGTSSVSCQERQKHQAGIPNSTHEMICKIRECDSDESDDIGIARRLKPANKKRKNRPLRAKSDPLHRNELKHVQFAVQDNRADRSGAESIKNFTSSEDEVPVKKVRSHKNYRYSKAKAVMLSSKSHPTTTANLHSRKPELTSLKPEITCIKKPSLSGNGTVKTDVILGSMDKLLDGVQEVVYTHSNQRMVGSSRAENHMSRSALRNVFEQGKFSQVPANKLLDSIETLSGQTQEAIPPVEDAQKAEADGSSCPVRPDHPVIQTQRKVHRTGQRTFLIGETPKAFCRKQLMEMASYFKSASVKELAEQIVRNTSESRQTMLRDFYTSQYPELKDILTIKLPQPTVSLKSALSGSSCKNKSDPKGMKQKSRCVTAESVATMVKRLRKSKSEDRNNYFQSEAPDTLGGSDSSVTQREERSSREKKQCSSQEHNFDQDIEKHKSSAGSNPGLRDSRKHQQAPSQYLSPQNNCRLQKEETNSPCPQKALLTELLGDTSILDDIFKTKGKGVESRKPSTSGALVKAKSRSKDVWDILSEGNEETMNRLTDLSVVESMCVDVKLPSKAKKEDVDCASHLWKKNENFLWKK
ncbi:DNA excision repair protein ERCC-6-like 2 [Amia ocellicauda]|uniref:DNA excision repair protein ERCC-6-like 2 n=1 Tax=Amia ocellicauda TaxID=2972642 RepID=UPI003463A531